MSLLLAEDAMITANRSTLIDENHAFYPIPRLRQRILMIGSPTVFLCVRKEARRRLRSLINCWPILTPS